MTSSGTPLCVLHLNSGNMFGGVETMLLTIARSTALCPELKSHFALCFDQDLAKCLRPNATVHLLPQARLRHPPSVYQSRKALWALLRENRFDAVVTHSSWIQLLYTDIVRQARLPLIFWMHNSFDGHWLQKLAAFQRPDYAICNSQFTRSSLDRCYPRVPSRVVYCPVSSPQPHADRRVIRASLRTKSDEVVILLAARPQPWKGHINLVRALARMKTQQPWRAWIAGGPTNSSEKEYLQLLQRQAESLGLSTKISFLGHRVDISSLMSAADIYCQPNEQPEPFGVVFVEALQAGVPVITYDMGGAREILNANTGILITPGDLDGLALALSKLIDGAEQRATLGSLGPSRAKALCDPSMQLRKIYETIRSVTSLNGGVAAS